MWENLDPPLMALVHLSVGDGGWALRQIHLSFTCISEGANLLSDKVLPKTAWKWKKLDRGGAFLVDPLPDPSMLTSVLVGGSAPENSAS